MSLTTVVNWLGGRKFALWLLGTVLYSVQRETFGAETFMWLTTAFMVADSVDTGVRLTNGGPASPQGLGWVAHALGGRRMTAFYVSTVFVVLGWLPGSAWQQITMAAMGGFAIQEVPKIMTPHRA